MSYFAAFMAFFECLRKPFGLTIGAQMLWCWMNMFYAILFKELWKIKSKLGTIIRY